MTKHDGEDGPPVLDSERDYGPGSPLAKLSWQAAVEAARRFNGAVPDYVERAVTARWLRAHTYHLDLADLIERGGCYKPDGEP